MQPSAERLQLTWSLRGVLVFELNLLHGRIDFSFALTFFSVHSFFDFLHDLQMYYFVNGALPLHHKVTYLQKTFGTSFKVLA